MKKQLYRQTLPEMHHSHEPWLKLGPWWIDESQALVSGYLNPNKRSRGFSPIDRQS